MARNDTAVDVLADEVEEFLEPPTASPGRDVPRAVGGLLLVLVSAQVLVLSATTVTVVAVAALMTGRRVGRAEGAVLLIAWFAILPLVA